MFSRIPRRVAVGVATIATVYALWWLATSGLRLLNPNRLPAPGEVWVAFMQILARGYAGATLWEHALHSLGLVARGFVAAELVGAFFGLGRVLNIAGQDIYPGMIMVGMAAVAICGAITTWILGRIERCVINWRPVV